MSYFISHFLTWRSSNKTLVTLHLTIQKIWQKVRHVRGYGMLTPCVWYCYSGLIGGGWGVALSGPSDLLSSPCSPPVQFPELFLHAHPASAQTVFSSFQHFPRIIYWGQLQLSSTQYKICTILVKVIVKTCMAFINVEKN